MYRPKINKKTMLELSLDLLEVIKKKIKEELYGNRQKKNKKAVNGFGRDNTNRPGKNISNLD
jgi:hypothetical protein